MGTDMERRLNNRGFTLVEMVMVMAIFVIVIMVTNGAFESIVGKASQQTKAAQSNIEGVIGLEILRADLDAAGFGLPWSIPASPELVGYTEADIAANLYVDGIDPSADFNDAKTAAPNYTPPRAVLTKAATSGSDYLVIKSTAVGMGGSAKRWSYVTYSSSSGIIKSWSNSDDNLVTDDRVISLNTTFDTAGKTTRQLVVKSDGTYSFRMSGGTAPSDFSPPDPSQSFMLYGIRNESGLAAGATLRMPFNRADYFIYRPSTVAARCAPGTGNIYKAPINHTGGGYSKLYPLLDCVLDMQVVFVRDVSNDGVISYTETLAGLTAQQIREQVKMVKVYILAQEGQKDKSFTYPAASIVTGPLDMPSLGKTWSSDDMEAKVGSDWKNYRWRVYEVAVQPRNLNR